jgi:hypothetical protein
LLPEAPAIILSRRGALRPDHAPYLTPIGPVKCPSPAGAATLAPILRTEDLTVRFAGLSALNQVNFEASETKDLALDVITPPAR